MKCLQAILAAAALTLWSGAANAASVYWSLFNIEDESAISADYVTYASRTDMLTDSNRLGVFTPTGNTAGRNIVGSGSDGTTWWSLFNIEGESAVSADYVTYASLMDMLTDTNRTGTFTPNSQSVGRNVVGSGSDGTTYWSLFNIEGESAVSADYVTYASLTDMLTDSNRLGVFTPSSNSAGRNIVGSGSDGATYWSLFNIEDESAISADYVTYASLTDMLTDSNRLGVFTPNSQSVGRNVVGSGAGMFEVAPPPPPPAAVIPLPAGFWLLGSVLAALGCAARRRARQDVAVV